MEPHERNAMSPAGQVDAWGDLAAGLKYDLSGRRRAVRMLAGLALVLLAAAGLVVLVV